MTQSEFDLTAIEDPTLSNQCNRLLRKLREERHLTSVEIWHKCSIWNGKGRICDLRKAGFCITTKMVKGKNKFDEDFHCAEYTLHE